MAAAERCRDEARPHARIVKPTMQSCAAATPRTAPPQQQLRLDVEAAPRPAWMLLLLGAPAVHGHSAMQSSLVIGSWPGR